MFLERGVYRRRRVIDAAKMLPFLALALFLLPALLLDEANPEENSTASRLVYFFCTWASLIAISFVLSRWLKPEAEKADRAPHETE